MGKPPARITQDKRVGHGSQTWTKLASYQDWEPLEIIYARILGEIIHSFAEADFLAGINEYCIFHCL